MMFSRFRGCTTTQLRTCSRPSGTRYLSSPAPQDVGMTERLSDYLNNLCGEEDILKRLRDESNTLPSRNMLLGSRQGPLLQLLVKMANAKKTLEIGVFTGYSTLSTALVLPEDGKIIALDVNKEWTDIAQRYWSEAGVRNKIDLRLGDAMSTLDDLIEADGEIESFDFIFIDADKQNYINYYERSMQLLRPGGVVVLDNVLWKGLVAEASNQNPTTNAIRRVNDRISSDVRADSSLLPVGDGFYLVRKK